MPFSSGTYTFPSNSFTPTPVFNTVIDETAAAASWSDLATALSLCMLKDGTQTVTANIPFSTFRLTGVGNATGLQDATTAFQAQNAGLITLSSVAGTATAITANATPTPSAYASGQAFEFIPASTNTGATTINVSSLGAKNIFANGAACVGGELVISVPTRIKYDGTQFNIIGSLFPRFKVGTFTRDMTAASGNVAYTGVGFRPKAVVFLGGVTTTNDLGCVGFDDGAAEMVLANDQSSAGRSIFNASRSILLLNAAAESQDAFIASFGDDGFTLTWAKTGSPTGTATLGYLALR